MRRRKRPFEKEKRKPGHRRGDPRRVPSSQHCPAGGHQHPWEARSPGLPVSTILCASGRGLTWPKPGAQAPPANPLPSQKKPRGLGQAAPTTKPAPLSRSCRKAGGSWATEPQPRCGGQHLRLEQATEVPGWPQLEAFLARCQGWAPAEGPLHLPEAGGAAVCAEAACVLPREGREAPPSHASSELSVCRGGGGHLQ